MLHSLGNTRNSLRTDHLLQTPDTFIRTPLPGASGVDFIVHAAPQLGAGFAMMAAEFREGGVLSSPPRGVQRFIYILKGELNLRLDGDLPSQTLNTGGFAYLPHNWSHRFEASLASVACLIEKSYQPVASAATEIKPVVGREQDLASEALGGDESLRVRRMMPDGAAWDFAVNTMTYDPGASLAQVEVHVMEHGLLMLEGGGIYRLGDSWYPVTAGDFIWMAPYCPQWFGALGKSPAKYLIYKDWCRHPLGAGE